MIKNLLVVVFLAAVWNQNEVQGSIPDQFLEMIKLWTTAPSCKVIKFFKWNAGSAEYTIKTKSNKLIKVFCEMDLNEGGYTFLKPTDLSKLTDDDVQNMFTDKTSFLMRSRKVDFTQNSGVLEQLPKYKSIQLKLGLSQNKDYQTPLNNASIGRPYLYFGFIPKISANNRLQQGIRVNGVDASFTNCDSAPNSYMALFPNSKKKNPYNYNKASKNYPLCDKIFNNLQFNITTKFMPDEYFQLGEIHLGGCGCYTSTDRLFVKNIMSMAIGFR